MRPGLRSRGATLIEVVVYSGVLLMLMGGVYFVVEGGMRNLRLAGAGQTASQQAMVGLRKILFELGPASQTSLEVSSLPQEHVTFLSPDPPEGGLPGYTFSGPLMEWKKWVSIFQDGTRIVRVEDELTSPTTDPASEAVPGFAADVLTWSPPKLLANNIGELRFNRLNSAVVTVEIVTSVQTGTDRTTGVELISSVRLLNE